MQPPIYNHHRLPITSSAPMPSVLIGGPSAGGGLGGGPAGGGGGVGGNGQGGPGGGGAGGNGRLLELLDAVKAEFEVAGQEGGQWRAQRDEYEGKLQAQIGELGLIRQALYELETQHNKVRQDYEAEIARLRTEITALKLAADPDGTGAGGGAGGAGGSAKGPALDLPPKPPAPDLPRPEGVKEGMLTGLPGPPLNGQAGGVGGLGLENTSAPRSPYPPAQTAPYRPPSVPAGHRSAQTDHRPSQPPSAAPPAPAPAPTQSQALTSTTAAAATPSGPLSPPVLLSDLDPENVSRELKKEGSDWFAVWSSQSKKILDVGLVHTLNHETVVCCVKFSNDGKFLATGCNRTAQIYDVKTGGKVCVLLDEQTTRSGDLYIRSICFSPDGKYLATGAEDRQIRIWDIKQKRIRHLLQGHMQEIYSLDFSRDGRFLVSGSGDKSARIWDIEKGVCVFDLRIEDFIHNEHGPIDAGITSVALSPDGKLVAAGSLDTMVRVWNVSTGQQVERLKGHKDSVYSVAFSPDGKSLVSGSLDRTLRVWDLTQTKRAVEGVPHGSKDSEKGLGTCQSTLNGHKDYVLSVAISPDGQWVVSGSKDRSIQFWNIATGQAQFMLQGHKNSVISIDLARSGQYLASGSGDCMARIWKYEAFA